MAILVRVNGGITGDIELIGAKYRYGRIDEVDTVDLLDIDGKVLQIIPLSQLKYLNPNYDKPTNEIPYRDTDGVVAVRVDGGIKNADKILIGGDIIVEKPRYKEILVLTNKEKTVAHFIIPIEHVRYIDYNYVPSKKKKTIQKETE